VVSANAPTSYGNICIYRSLQRPPTEIPEHIRPDLEPAAGVIEGRIDPKITISLQLSDRLNDRRWHLAVLTAGQVKLID
jgi:hypothetical protein